jgi:hypothetical protein
MQITYELTQKDFTEAYSVHRNSRPWSKWARRAFICIASLGAAFVLFGFSVHPTRQQAQGLIPLFALVAVWIGVLWLLPKWIMRRQFQQQPGAHGPRTLTLDETGAHWRWSGGSSDVEWKNYIRSAEGKNQVLFYTSPACFNIVPKRAFAGEQLSDLRLSWFSLKWRSDVLR